LSDIYLSKFPNLDATITYEVTCDNFFDILIMLIFLLAAVEMNYI